MEDLETRNTANKRLIAEAVVVAVIASIVSKLAERIMGGDIIPAVAGGVAGGLIALGFLRQARAAQ